MHLLSKEGLMKRIFIGVLLPENLRKSLLSLQAGLSGVRLIPMENMHLTLRFVGLINELEIRDLDKTLSSIEFEEFPMCLEGVGVFPFKGAAKTLWVGLSTNKALIRFQALIEKKCRSVGLQADSRNYHPHITLGRVRYLRQNEISNWLSTYQSFKSDDFLLDQFQLIHSILNSSGSVYNCISTYKLAINHELHDFNEEDFL